MAVFAAFAADRQGGVSVLTAFALPALIGALALGTEVSYWYVKIRALQNAADSAAIAATIDDSDAFLAQARAVTARYGLIDGRDGVTVAGSRTATCPDGSPGCTRITVAAAVPVYLGAVIGYLGNSREGGHAATRISALAIARPGAGAPYCLIALATGGADPAIASSGAPRPI